MKNCKTCRWVGCRNYGKDVTICVPYECKEITEHIDRCGKWYITYRSGETRYCDTELEMYKALYYGRKPVSVYGKIY